MENVFGIPMNVRSRTQAEQEVSETTTYYACMRCEDMPASRIPAPVRERNLIERCAVCRHLVWVDPKAYISPAMIVCLQHTPSGDEVEYRAVRETVDEVRSYYPDAR